MSAALISIVHEVAQPHQLRWGQARLLGQFAPRRRLGRLGGIDEAAWQAEADAPWPMAIARHRNHPTIRLHGNDHNEAAQLDLPEIRDHMAWAHRKRGFRPIGKSLAEVRAAGSSRGSTAV